MKTRIALLLLLIAVPGSFACGLVQSSGPMPAPTTISSITIPSTPIPTLGDTPEPSATAMPVQSPISQQNPMRYRVRFSATLKNEGFKLQKLLVYQPRPIAWDGQQDVNVETVSPVPSKQGEDPVFGNGLYYWDIKQDMPRTGESLQFKIIFTYTAYEIVSKIDPNDLQPYDTNTPLYKLYTRPERFIESTDPQIVEIADQVAAGEENPFLLARKYYDYVVENAHYRLVGKGLLGAKALLVNDEGECGDFSSLFIALARAKGIPARSVVGYWAITGTEQTHVWAEFYLEGIGWIPVDPTLGQLSSEDKSYYFGNMDNQRVILQKGFNLPLDPPVPGDNSYLAPLMQGPYYWFWGDGDGNKVSLDVTEWNVTENPVSTPATETKAASACPYQADSDDATITRIIQAEAEAALKEDMSIIRAIFAPDATIRSELDGTEWHDPVARYLEIFATLEVVDSVHFGIQPTGQGITEDTAWYISGSSGTWIPNEGEPVNYYSEPGREEWVLKKNELGCWVIVEYSYH